MGRCDLMEERSFIMRLALTEVLCPTRPCSKILAWRLVEL